MNLHPTCRCMWKFCPYCINCWKRNLVKLLPPLIATDQDAGLGADILQIVMSVLNGNNSKLEQVKKLNPAGFSCR
ncbi:hypothetical protein POPTR_005G097250v4 [Populus trichocarpa]|uniref:Uncharacterized protein n=1 Tax=Populus trichocarpa TaxID=3694 RepID=A0ACC0SYY0_POPTR|nr:hypothetical protein BDE02_05G081400 [Populus trichocarpa]KAI9394471.1 hypothetical protein POPTR_005G097250v4 [Populus trichocarpa]